MNFEEIIVKKINSKRPKDTSFSFLFPNGKLKKFGDKKDQFRIEINTPHVYTAIATKGPLGLGEQFMLGNFDIKGDFDIAIITLARMFARDELNQGNFFYQTLHLVKKQLLLETKDRALKDINAHYDISNDFYKLFLDPTMTYSCAYFKKETDSLEMAQVQKYEHVCRKLQLHPGETLLDIGCGWGGMLIYAAQKYKIHGYGVTLSKNQYTYAKEKIKELGLEKHISIELKDYRDIKGEFDKFVSIGMFEHVTKNYYDDFFRMVKNSLVTGGLGVLHTISVNDPTIELGPWYHAYIFPGAQVPALSWIIDHATKYGLCPLDLENLRPHYALTLKHWAKNFERSYPKVVKNKGEKFARMWKLYLYESRASFVTGLTQLYQLTFTNGVNNKLPLTRDFLYN